MFVCEVCGKTFTEKRSLTRHMKIHGQRERFFCPTCPSSFTRREHLNRHVRTIHGRDDQPGPSTSQLPSPVASTSRGRSRSPLRRPENPRTETNVPGVLPEDPETQDLYLRHWHTIQTQETTGNPVQDRFNFTLHEITSATFPAMVQHIFRTQRTAFRINISFGFILRHIETGELRYYHPSQNNARFLDTPHLIRNEDDLNRFLEELSRHDILEYIREQRPDTKWVVHLLTNVTFYVNKIKDHPIGSHIFLPDFITRNAGIVALVGGSNGSYQDNLCLFRCIAVHRGAPVKYVETPTKTYFQQYLNESKKSEKKFKGVAMEELPVVEKLFQTNIFVYQLKEDDETGNINAELIRRTPSRFPNTMYLNLFGNHFSYIKDLKMYSKSFSCSKCGKLWKSCYLLTRHEATCEAKVRYCHPGGVYHPTPSIFEQIEGYDIDIPDELKYYPYRATYDIEAMLQSTDRLNAKKLKWTSTHVPLSISVSSNIPNRNQPICFVSEGDPNVMVGKAVEYLNTLAREAHQLLAGKYEELLDVMEDRMTEHLDPEDEKIDIKKKKHPLYKLQLQLQSHLHELPVIGFNSGKYDLNAMKISFFSYLVEHDHVKFVVKKNNNYMCVKTETLKFLDITNYLAPGFSYAQFLKAYGCSEEKGYFPYEWMTTLEKLNNTELPPHSAFYSSLKNSNITEEEYRFCQELWIRNNMSTMKDFLVFYNNKDVQPFLQALEKIFTYYQNQKLDMFKDAISVPGLTLKYMFQGLDDYFTTPDKWNTDLYSLMKTNIVGGPSIVFHRYHEKDVTFLRPAEFPNPKLCRRILGFDANGLYLWSIMEFMPSGHFVRRKLENDFKRETPRRYEAMAIKWLEWEANRSGLHIQHQGNNKEKKIGKYPVDGYCKETNTVYQFDGCIFHGHSCELTRNTTVNPVSGLELSFLHKRTEERNRCIRQYGHHLVIMRECEWKRSIKQNPELQRFVDSMKRPCDHMYKMTQEQIIRSVMEDKMFGALEVDIHVPLHLYSKFSEMSPIFKNTEISRDDIGDHMRQYAIDHDMMSTPRKSLIGSMFGEKIMIITPLLKWYLTHGLVVTKIYQVVEYTPVRCFQKLGEQISDARRAGDADPNKKILAETNKLTGNSMYGTTATNKEKHRKIAFCNENNVYPCINNPFFRRCNQLNDDTYEVEMSKKVINLDLPIHIACFVYQYAKLRMLQFYYDFMDVFVDRKDFQYCAMDTDSAYMALSADTLEEVIKPELYKRYQAEKHLWFPRDDTPEHAAYDKRTPGLFKVEYEGDGIIALCSKTYFCFGNEDKYSCKGINKKLNTITKNTYMDVLLSKKSGSGTNRGFRSVDNKIYSYLQERAGFSYFYPKRKVLEDGISTTPLDL